MKRRHHIKIFMIASIIWAAFFVAGLPSYYQQYSVLTMVWFELFLLAPITVVFYFVLRRLHADKRLVVALWLAFYFTAPLAIYDWLYCGVYLGHGIGFVVTYWYLTVYYIVPWLLLPLIAKVIDLKHRALES